MDVQWDTLFQFGVAPLELIIRGTLMYWFIFVALRMAGRRDLGSLGISSILLLVLISEAASNGMSANYQSVGEGMVLVGTLFFWSVFVDRVNYFFPAMRGLLSPERICLVRDGVMQKRSMRREYITESELMAELRLKGINDLAEVRRAYIEETGEVSVQRRRRGRETGA
ncbi:DUF421 domain-containing protein [Alcaligenaceae bacterium]|nr:DUF421 domain-containing protein [Alcaligenaceae bacterium]